MVGSVLGAVTQGSSRTLAARPRVEADVVIAEAQLASPWSFMHRTITSSWETAEAGADPTFEQKRRLRPGATLATHRSDQESPMTAETFGPISFERPCDNFDNT